MFPPLSYSFGYLFAPDKPLDHVHLKCTQLIAGASASTDVEYVLQAESNVVHLLKYYHDYNEQTFIISVCILRFHLFAVFTCRHGSLFLQKTFRDVGAGLWYCLPHLMHLAIAMFADHPSGQSDLKVNIHDFKHNLCFLVMHNSSYLALSNVKYLDKLPLNWLP